MESECARVKIAQKFSLYNRVQAVWIFAEGGGMVFFKLIFEPNWFFSKIQKRIAMFFSVCHVYVLYPLTFLLKTIIKNPIKTTPAMLPPIISPQGGLEGLVSVELWSSFFSVSNLLSSSSNLASSFLFLVSSASCSGVRWERAAKVAICCLILDSWFLILDSWFLILDSWFLILDLSPF